MKSSIDLVAGIALLAVFAAGTVVIYTAEAVWWNIGDWLSGKRRIVEPPYSPITKTHARE
jgi:hypothetical protein